MQERFRAIVNDGRIEPLEDIEVPDGTQLLVTVVTNGDDFWMTATQSNLDAIWNNSEDDIYGELLKG
ncbi:MAG TPA: hypothetical protein VIT88_09165 [Pyrinomonadaceae bacterium]